MKKLLVIAALSAIMALALVGCGEPAQQSSSASDASQATAATESSQASEATEESEATEATEAAEESEATEAEEATEEDGQNPLMNFVGPYACDRATMDVQADGMENAIVTITWGASADSNAEWVIKGYFEPDTLSISYSDAVKTVYVYNPDGSVKSEEVEYSDGAGKLIFHDGSPISVTWQNENEPDNGAMEFTWNF